MAPTFVYILTVFGRSHIEIRGVVRCSRLPPELDGPDGRPVRQLLPVRVRHLEQAAHDPAGQEQHQHLRSHGGRPASHTQRYAFPIHTRTSTSRTGLELTHGLV